MDSSYVYTEVNELSDAAKNTAKGASIGATVGSAVPVFGTGIGAGAGAAAGFISSFIGKKGKKYGVGDCGEPVPSAVSEMLSNISPQDRARLASAYSAANKGKPMPGSAAEISFAAYGGRDCKVTSSSGKTFKRIFDELMSKYGPGGSQRNGGAGAFSPAEINPLYMYAGGGMLLISGILIATISNKKDEA